MAKSGLLYKDVALALRARIAGGTYPPGSRIPGLHELVAEFSVSTITVRRALRELVSEGLLYGQQGLGVFVQPKRKIHRLLAGQPDKSIGDEIRRAGFEPVSKECAFLREKADPETARRLQLRPGAALYRHEKVTFADGEAISLHALHIPARLALRLRQGLGHKFIFELLKEQGIPISHSRFEFASSVVDQELAPVFRLPVGFPLLQVHYTPIGRDGVPALTGVATCRADMFVFEVDVSAAGSLAGGS